MPNYPVIPYGEGVFRRHIRLLNSAGKVEGWLADDIHSFKVTLHYANGEVTDVEGEAHRHPWLSCDGAISKLRELIGAPILDDSRAYAQYTNPRSQCTHWFDLAGLALAHTGSNEAERLYKITIPDIIDNKTCLYLSCNNTEVLQLNLDGNTITAPAQFSGQDITKGFARWAQENLQGEQLEAALLLYRARFVSLARALYGGAIDGKSGAPGEGRPTGVCYTYSEGIIEHTERATNYHRDFSDDETQVLQFQ